MSDKACCGNNCNVSFCVDFIYVFPITASVGVHCATLSVFAKFFLLTRMHDSVFPAYNTALHSHSLRRMHINVNNALLVYIPVLNHSYAAMSYNMQCIIHPLSKSVAYNEHCMQWHLHGSLRQTNVHCYLSRCRTRSVGLYMTTSVYTKR